MELAEPRCPKPASKLRIHSLSHSVLPLAVAFHVPRLCLLKALLSEPQQFLWKQFWTLPFNETVPEQTFRAMFSTPFRNLYAAKMPAWTFERIVAFYIPHHFFEASARAQWGQGKGSGWLQGLKSAGTDAERHEHFDWALSLARRCLWGTGVPGPSCFPCSGKDSSASYQAAGRGAWQ